MEAVREIFFYVATLSFVVSLISVPLGVMRKRRRKARVRAHAQRLVDAKGLDQAGEDTAQELERAQQSYQQIKTPSPTKAQLTEGKKMYKKILELHALHEEIKRIRRQAGSIAT